MHLMNDKDYNLLDYPPPTRRTTNMLTVSLFRGTNNTHERLIDYVPQNHPQNRRLILLAVIHEPDIKACVEDPKIMLYQGIDDPDHHYWVRKETPGGENGRTNYAESGCEDAITALGGFEASVRLMLDRLGNRSAASDAEALFVNAKKSFEGGLDEASWSPDPEPPEGPPIDVIREDGRIRVPS